MYKPPTLYRRSFHLREASLANRLDEKRQISKLERVSRICSRAGIPFPLFPFLTSSFSLLSSLFLARCRVGDRLPRERRTSVVRQSVSRRVINQSSSRTCETRSAALSRALDRTVSAPPPRPTLLLEEKGRAYITRYPLSR